MNVDQGTFIVGRNKLEADQILSPDPSTYEMLHNLSTPWPCLSFDLVRDHLGDDRKVYPATMYAVAGTQAEHGRSRENQLLVTKLSGLSRMEREDDSEDEGEGDDEDSDPILESKSIPLDSTSNRVRTWQDGAPAGSIPTTLSAVMTESSDVYIHDVTPHLTSFDNPGTVISPLQNQPQHTIRAHRSEGYALDWSRTSSPRLLTGDNDGMIHLTSMAQGGFETDLKAFKGHTSSVEEIQWSPSEESVFASSSSDGTVRIWDIRSKSRKAAITVQASTTDVNVMSWSRQTSHLLASGADDGEWAVWDLRQWKGGVKPTPLASFD
ncbi:WD40 domain-containing protein, partial [Candidatus Bathyarchaeota archaeon]|nr:WD40 domain-containing protein [Candidatus Bathyarchaeota archaeon]